VDGSCSFVVRSTSCGVVVGFLANAFCGSVSDLSGFTMIIGRSKVAWKLESLCLNLGIERFKWVFLLLFLIVLWLLSLNVMRNSVQDLWIR
jgi:hypothetical protein